MRAAIGGDEQHPDLERPRLAAFLRDRTERASAISSILSLDVGGDSPSAPYPATWVDALNPTGDPMNENSGQTYAVFASSAPGGFQTRTNVVYAGANDGFLHGFRSGSYDSGNNYIKANNDGLEVLAYMPRHVERNIQTATGTLPV